MIVVGDIMEFLILTVILIIFILVIIFFLMRQESTYKRHISKFNEQANNDKEMLSNVVNMQLDTFKYSILSEVQRELKHLNVDTNDRLNLVSKEVQKELNLGMLKTNDTFSEVSKQLVTVNETQKNLDNLSKQILDLEKILTDKSTRGKFGEIELYSILENSYGIHSDFYAKQYQLSNGVRADAILFGIEALGDIVVDAKFPLENYARMYDENLVVEERNRASTQFKRDVKKHIDDISSKYIVKHETAEIAFLFVPAEAIFAEIYGRHEDVVQYSYKQKVYIVSPSTIMAYITTLKSVYLGIEQNEKIDLMQVEFSLLAKEFERFAQRSKKLASSYEAVYNDMRNLEITTEKIQKRFNEIMAVDLEDKVK